MAKWKKLIKEAKKKWRKCNEWTKIKCCAYNQKLAQSFFCRAAFAATIAANVFLVFFYFSNWCLCVAYFPSGSLSIFIQVSRIIAKTNIWREKMEKSNNTMSVCVCASAFTQFDSVTLFSPRFVLYVRDITMISFSHLLTSSLHFVNAIANTISLVYSLCFQFFIGQTDSVNWRLAWKKKQQQQQQKM